MPEQVPKSIKHSRAKSAAAVAAKTKDAFLAAQEGKILSVLFEQEEETGVWSGHTPNYLLVRAKGEALKNCVFDVLITGHENGELIGEIQNFTKI